MVKLLPSMHDAALGLFPALGGVSGGCRHKTQKVYHSEVFDLKVVKVGVQE